MSSYGQVTIGVPTAATYLAATGWFTPASSPTDVAVLTGSASKTITVLKVWVGASNTTLDNTVHTQVDLVKRSTADSGGTSSAITPVPTDSANTATATSASYTANPTTGTLVGKINSTRITNAMPSQLIFDASVMGQGILLKGTSQQLAVNLTGLTLAVNGGTGQVSASFLFRED